MKQIAFHSLAGELHGTPKKINASCVHHFL